MVDGKFYVIDHLGKLRNKIVIRLLIYFCIVLLSNIHRELLVPARLEEKEILLDLGKVATSPNQPHKDLCVLTAQRFSER